MQLELEECERQMLVMALAHLSVERPGWDDALNRIAVRIDNVKDGRAVMYDEFRSLHKAAERKDLKPSGAKTVEAEQGKENNDGTGAFDRSGTAHGREAL